MLKIWWFDFRLHSIPSISEGDKMLPIIPLQGQLGEHMAVLKGSTLLK